MSVGRAGQKTTGATRNSLNTNWGVLSEVAHRGVVYGRTWLKHSHLPRFEVPGPLQLLSCLWDLHMKHHFGSLVTPTVLGTRSQRARELVQDNNTGWTLTELFKLFGGKYEQVLNKYGVSCYFSCCLSGV